jgi:hypothetical protein
MDISVSNSVMLKFPVSNIGNMSFGAKSQQFPPTFFSSKKCHIVQRTADLGLRLFSSGGHLQEIDDYNSIIFVSSVLTNIMTECSSCFWKCNKNSGCKFV